MTSLHVELWKFFNNNPGGWTPGAIIDILKVNDGAVSIIQSALDSFAKTNLVDKHGDKYSVAPEWAGVAMHFATPSRIHKNKWGCCIPKGSPSQGELVSIKTKKGVIFEPKSIKEVVYQRDYGVVCSYEDIPDTNPNHQKGEEPAIDKMLENIMGELDGIMGELDGGEKDDVTPEPVVEAPVMDVEVNEGMVRSIVDNYIKGGGLNSLINQRVQSEVAKHVRPAVIEVKTPDENVQRVEGAHYLFPRLLRLVGAGFNVFMWGPPGTGKTTAALQVAKALNRSAEIDTLDPTTARSMVQGYMTPSGEPVHNVFTRCWEGGHVYVADEVDLAPGHVQTLFNSALANGSAPLAWGNKEKAEGFAFVATGNTSGRPTAAFPDRRPMSNAFMDRLYFLYWPLDPAIECRAVGLPTPPVKEEGEHKEVTPAAWVTFVRNLRDWASANAPTLTITPRASLLGVRALAAGESPAQVADGLIFRGCDDDLKRKALHNVTF